jgi:hypothetical protein
MKEIITLPGMEIFRNKKYTYTHHSNDNDRLSDHPSFALRIRGGPGKTNKIHKICTM